MSVVIDVQNLKKTYRTPFSRKLVHAVQGISLQVHQGEAFGFLGPNGAGKTTTIRTLMGLIRPTSGTATIFGHPVGSREARMRLGFLPEAPYFYEYLSVTELIDLAGRIFGLNKALRRKRCDELIELVGLGHAADKALKTYSKGMLQRAGIAQALVNDPDLVVLDEPMSGLDPVGRKEVRDIVVGLRERGKTVFFSSHILADVEMLAEKIAIVAQGRVRAAGPLSELVSQSDKGTLVTWKLGSLSDFDALFSSSAVDQHEVSDESLQVSLAPSADLNEFIRSGLDLGATLVSVVPIRETLEDAFMASAMGAQTRDHASHEELE